jgi:hypothetical protein
MAALAFTAYGVHWFALGWIRLRQADARANIGMTIAFVAISVLGIIVSSGWPCSAPSSPPRCMPRPMNPTARGGKGEVARLSTTLPAKMPPPSQSVGAENLVRTHRRAHTPPGAQTTLRGRNASRITRMSSSRG